MRSIFIISSIFILLAVVLYTSYHFMYPKRKIYQSEVTIPQNTKADSVAVYKEKRKMILYSEGKELKTYSISLGKNPVGHKQKEGDKKTPEGNYMLDSRNPNSKYHLSIHISYPSEQDRLNAEVLGVPPGGDIFIHGLPNKMEFLEDYYVNTDWTDGCIAVTNDEIEEIWNAVDGGTPITIYP